MRPQVTPALPWRFPPHESTTLPNGLKVWHFHLPGQHMTTFRVVLPAPLTCEPRTLEGVGAITLNAIDEGTRSHPNGAITELLERHGAALHGATWHRHTTIGGQAPSRRLHEVLPLFVEVLAEPAYCPADVAHHVESAIADYRSRLASPAHANRLALAGALFGEHRNARPTTGTPATLVNLTPEDVTAWHANHFSPEGATLVVAGSGTLSDIVDPLSQWEATSTLRPKSQAPDPTPPRSVVVDHPAAVQTALTLAKRTITRQDDAWPALRVASHAMVTAFGSRLNAEIRERLGYSYGIGGGLAPGISESQFTVSAAVRTAVTHHTLERVLDILALGKPFTTTEVEDARNYLIGVAPMANETSEDIVSQASALAAAGLTPKYLASHFERLAEVTAEEASQTFRRLIDPSELTLAATGLAPELSQTITELGREPELVDLSLT